MEIILKISPEQCFQQVLSSSEPPKTFVISDVEIVPNDAQKGSKPALSVRYEPVENIIDNPMLSTELAKTMEELRNLEPF